MKDYKKINFNTQINVLYNVPYIDDWALYYSRFSIFNKILTAILTDKTKHFG